MARILLGVSGGIAAYKAVELVRLATRAGHAVRVVQTPTSRRFVGKATFEGVTGAPVLVHEFEPDPARGAFPGDAAPDRQPISHLGHSYYHNLGEGTFDEYPPPMVETGSKNYLKIALDEVAEGKINYRYRD